MIVRRIITIKVWSASKNACPLAVFHSSLIKGHRMDFKLTIFSDYI